MQQFTTIGAVREILIRHFAQTGETLNFHSAVHLLENDRFTCERPRIPQERLASIMPDDAFFALLLSLPVITDWLMQKENMQFKQEETIFPLDRDIIGFCILPHVDDGLHIHDHFEVNYIYSGQAVIHTDSDSRMLQKGDCFFISPDMPHNILAYDEDSIVLSIMIRRSAFEPIISISTPLENLIALFFDNASYAPGNGRYLFFRTDPEDRSLRKLMQDIMLSSNSDRLFSDSLSTLLLFQFFCILLQDYSDGMVHFGLGRETGDARAFPRILLEIQKNYRTLTLEKLAQITNYSPSYLSRMIQKNLGRSFSNLIQLLKMRETARLLLNTELSIAQITEQVGYDSPNYLTRTFKQHYQVTPSEYRRQRKK